MDITKEREEINHFSHTSHPLKLVKSETIVCATLDKHDAGQKPGGVIGCYACKNPISSGFAYGCIQCCHFMHKACAQLPLTINLPSLYEQPLTIYDFGPTDAKSWLCDVCRILKTNKGFCYNFEESEYNSNFNACIDCCVVEIARKAEADVIKEEAMIKLVEYEGHPQHTLSLQLRPGAFRCDACNTDDKGLFYLCDSCDFWIHKTCASLAPTIYLSQQHPNHPLTLVYSLPEKFYKFSYYCEFCSVYIRRNDWLYHCANCRYFSHIKCALSNVNLPSTPRDGPRTHDPSTSEEVDNLLQFPMSNSFTDPLKLLHSEMMAPDDVTETVINHWGHHHPLTLHNVEHQQANLSGDCDQLEVCHGCVRPLSLPYYSCKLDGCSFVLHKYCAKLPLKLEHQLHPGHSLDLTPKPGSYYQCSGCFGYGNKYFYKCETCKFYLDVNCAFLPKSIKHKSHKHPLVQVIDPGPLCSVCDKWSGYMSYACSTCNFILGMHCAMRLPNSIAHRYCKGHEIPLMYPPIMDHPEDFFCDICEKEMHPKAPLYYCEKCKNSFHPRCISQSDEYENMVYEGSRNVSYHKHPLTYVRRKKRSPKYVCSNCNTDINGFLILECRARICNFNTCVYCHFNK